MKKILIPILLCAAFLSVVRCETSPFPNKIVNDNSFTLECDSPLYNSTDSLITFPVTGGQVQFRVIQATSSVAWGMKCDLDDNWCKYVKAVETFIVKAGENTGGERESFFYVVVGENSQKINVLQEYIPALAFAEDTVHVKFVGSDAELHNNPVVTPLNTNIKDKLIAVSCDQTWVTNLSVSRGKLYFKVAPNEAAEDRYAKIAIEAESLKDTLVVWQDMFGKEPNPLVLPDPIWVPVLDL